MLNIFATKAVEFHKQQSNHVQKIQLSTFSSLTKTGNCQFFRHYTNNLHHLRGNNLSPVTANTKTHISWILHAHLFVSRNVTVLFIHTKTIPSSNSARSQVDIKDAKVFIKARKMNWVWYGAFPNSAYCSLGICLKTINFCLHLSLCSKFFFLNKIKRDAVRFWQSRESVFDWAQ